MLNIDFLIFPAVLLADINVRSTSAVGALRQAIARTQDNAAAWDYTAAQILTAGRDAIESSSAS